MGALVSEIITKTRSLLDDGLADHLSQDDLTEQVDGVNTLFRLFNRNVIEVAGGAPADLKVYVGNTLTVPASKDTVAGTFIFTVAPTLGSKVRAFYYFSLMVDADYIGFTKMAAEFVGNSPTFTLITEDSGIDRLLESAATKFAAALGAKKMSNLTSWYYSSNAGNKGFNKDSIATKFKDMAEELLKEAVAERNDVYKRHGKREAPAMQIASVGGFMTYTPRR